MALFKRFLALLKARPTDRLVGARLALLGLAIAAVAVVSASSTIRAEDELERIPMRFALARSANHGNCTDDCVEWIVAQGRIMINSPQQLDMVMRSLGPRRPPLLIHSLGGNVQAALQLGEKIRRYGLPVVIAKTDLKPCAEDKQGLCPSPTDEIVAIRTTPAQGVCVSSCAYMMLGGTTRMIPPGARVAVHQFFQTEDGKSLKLKKKTYTAEEFGSSQYLTAELAKYLARMGVSMGFLEVASNTPPVTVHILTPGELQRYRVSCDAECARQALAIEQSDGPIILPAPNLAPDPEPKSAWAARDEEDLHKVSANVRLTGQRTAAQANLTIGCTPGSDRITYELSVSVGPRATLQPKYFQLSADTKSIVLIGDDLPPASGNRGATFKATTPLASLGDLVHGDELVARFGEIDGQPVSASFPTTGLAGLLARWPSECFKSGSAPLVTAHGPRPQVASGWMKMDRHGQHAAAIAFPLKNDRAHTTGGLLLACDVIGGKAQTHYELNIDTDPRTKAEAKYFELVADKHFLVAISDQPHILPHADYETLTIDKPMSDFASLLQEDTLTLNFGNVNGHPVSTDLATKDLRPLLATWPQACTRAMEAKPDTPPPARTSPPASAITFPPSPIAGVPRTGSYGRWAAFNQGMLHYVAIRIGPTDTLPGRSLDIYLACEVAKGGRRLRLDGFVLPSLTDAPDAVELLADGTTLIGKTNVTTSVATTEGKPFTGHTALQAIVRVMNSSRLTLRLTLPEARVADLDIPKVGLGDALNTWPADCLQSVDAAP